jgi:hypothetical protein
VLSQFYSQQIESGFGLIVGRKALEGKA